MVKLLPENILKMTRLGKLWRKYDLYIYLASVIAFILWSTDSIGESNGSPLQYSEQAQEGVEMSNVKSAKAYFQAHLDIERPEDHIASSHDVDNTVDRIDVVADGNNVEADGSQGITNVTKGTDVPTVSDDKRDAETGAEEKDAVHMEVTETKVLSTDTEQSNVSANTGTSGTNDNIDSEVRDAEVPNVVVEDNEANKDTQPAENDTKKPQTTPSVVTLKPVTFAPGMLGLYPTNDQVTKHNKPVITNVSLHYDFAPFENEEANELAEHETMDYVKGYGYMYIYNNESYINHEFNNKSEMKTILLFNQYYADNDYKFGLGHEPFREHWCTINRCRTTNDLKELSTADAVIFFIHGLDFSSADIIPPHAHGKQLYVFWNHESPFYRTRNQLRRFGTMFNLTVTYRMDSSIPLPTYQTRARVNKNIKARVSSYHIREKSGLAVWMISACHKVGSLRHQYAKELAKFIPLDTYGQCGNLTCPRNMTTQCLQDMEKKYKFYLAFENSMCRDYITEKPFRTLTGNWVPVVMGSGDYKKHLPPHSYIDVRNFKSPQHLGEYLLFLDQDEAEYLKYFEWKTEWLIWRVHTKVALCQLCEILHGNGTEKIRSDLDIEQWWEKDGECIVPEKLKKYLHYVRY